MGLAAPLEPAYVDWASVPDGDVVRAIAEDRDREAFAELFSRYGSRVRAVLVAGGLAPTLADDLTQEILLEIWRRAERYDPTRASVATWIFTICRSRRIDALRRERVHLVEVEVDPGDPVPSHELGLDRERSATALRVALADLPPEQAAVLDGGLKKWTAEGKPVSSDVVSLPPATFTATFQADRIATGVAAS